MRITRTIAEARAALRELRSEGQIVGLVPTMGALHAGHASLVRAACAQSDLVVVSIFVNPTQFAPNEDFAKYPRTWEDDCALLKRERVNLLFAPSTQEMYPDGASTFIEVVGLSGRLDGASRPGHFHGVATVVAKLFQIIQPAKAFFGQKDAAQIAVLRRMVRDLDFNLELVVCPTVREPDGLALSSRNRYLSPDERRQALVLSRALRRTEEQAAQGITGSEQLVRAAFAVFAEEPEVRVDYCKVVNPDTLEDVADSAGGALVAVAAFVGTTRLIDNIVLHPAGHH
ncbi:MAG: pantoate--beta-alanine ligase [Acidobacteriaceae bacterium]|nr:pantoate--beta-alanine ligase [Acidobacteriaceae bacterium]